jgi:hypothetical protein
MGRKPKAGGAKGKTTDPEQFAQFLEAARQAGVDETGEAFERAFERITAPKRPAPVKGRPSGPARKPRPAR